MMSHPDSPFGNYYSQTEIPYFSGEYVDWWIYHIECFYQRQTLPEMKIKAAEIFLSGEALQWYRSWDFQARWSWRRVIWEDFVTDLRNRFTLVETPKPQPSKSQSEVWDSVFKKLIEIEQKIATMMLQISQKSTTPCPFNQDEDNLTFPYQSVQSIEEVICPDGEQILVPVEKEIPALVVEEISSIEETVSILISREISVPVMEDLSDNTYMVPFNSSIAFQSNMLDLNKVSDNKLQGHMKSEKSNHKLNDHLQLCLTSVCENTSQSLNSTYITLIDFIQSCCSIRIIKDIGSYIKPPTKPPDRFLSAELSFCSNIMGDLELYSIQITGCLCPIKLIQTGVLYLIPTKEHPLSQEQFGRGAGGINISYFGCCGYDDDTCKSVLNQTKDISSLSSMFICDLKSQVAGAKLFTLVLVYSNCYDAAIARDPKSWQTRRKGLVMVSIINREEGLLVLEEAIGDHSFTLRFEKYLLTATEK